MLLGSDSHPAKEDGIRPAYRAAGHGDQHGSGCSWVSVASRISIKWIGHLVTHHVSRNPQKDISSQAAWPPQRDGGRVREAGMWRRPWLGVIVIVPLAVLGTVATASPVGAARAAGTGTARGNWPETASGAA